MKDLIPEEGIIKPWVFFTNDAYLKMRSLVTTCKEEIAWHGVVRKASLSEYYIEDILVYPQTVTGVTVTSDQQAYSEWLYAHEDEVFNNLRLQGHSHVNMGTTPSGVDNALYEAILSQITDNDYYIFLITNKSGDVNIWIYDMAQNIIFEKEDITVRVLLQDQEQTLAEWTSKVIDTAITKRTPVVNKVQTGYYGRQEMTTDDIPGYSNFGAPKPVTYSNYEEWYKAQNKKNKKDKKNKKGGVQ